MSDKIIIRDLKVEGIIGTKPEEQQKPQEVLVNAILKTDLRKPGFTDLLPDTTDYEALSNRICEVIQNNKRQTVEALATDIVRALLENKRIKEVSLQLEKPQALPNTRSVGIRIKRERKDL